MAADGDADGHRDLGQATGEGWFAASPHHATAFDQLLATVRGPATAGALLGSFPETRQIVGPALLAILEGGRRRRGDGRGRELADAALTAHEAAS